MYGREKQWNMGKKIKYNLGTVLQSALIRRFPVRRLLQSPSKAVKACEKKGWQELKLHETRG